MRRVFFCLLALFGLALGCTTKPTTLRMEVEKDRTLVLDRPAIEALLDLAYVHSAEARGQMTLPGGVVAACGSLICEFTFQAEARNVLIDGVFGRGTGYTIKFGASELVEMGRLIRGEPLRKGSNLHDLIRAGALDCNRARCEFKLETLTTVSSL